KSLKDTKGARLALGDVNSTSSFVYPVAMLMDAGVDPARDMGQVVITGSHANSLKAVAEGKADLSGASFDSFEKAVKQGRDRSDQGARAGQERAYPTAATGDVDFSAKKDPDEVEGCFQQRA
ncbi:MAG: PhnD/SsuA/transferrin family substrate-binding protein, partial [Pseudomonadota bacterium]